MDGPNVNWSVYDKFSTEVDTECNANLINIGSSGLHTLHNAFKAGIMTASGFDVGSLLSSLYWLFKDTSARREDFTDITGSTVFPLSYCGYRWLENFLCMERALVVLPHIRQFVKKIKEKTKSEPTCRSFKIVKESLDSLEEAKLEACLTIARNVTPFLKKYQTDSPMLPFFSNDCFQVMRRLLSRCIKQEYLDSCTEAKDIHKLDFSNPAIYLTTHKIDIGAAAKACLKQSKASEKEVLGFRVAVLDFMKAVVKKMVEKSPLKYRLVRCCAFMDPAVMIQDKAPKLLSQALDIMLEAKRISASAADEVKDEFLEFCTDLKVDSSDTYGLFLSFCPESSRVDKFLHTHLSIKSPKLWEFVKTLLLLSHGQASVERGFSFNKEISVENLKEHSVVAQRRVLQYIRHCGGTTEVPVTKALLTAAASGRQNYTAYLEKEKERKRCEEKKRKREEWDSELDQLKEKKKRLIREKEDLVHSTDQLARQAEDKQNFSMLTKSNAMREKNQTLQ